MQKILDGTKETNSHFTQFVGKPVLAVDFDHTITTKCMACDDGLENDGIQKGAKEALDELSKDFRIWIYTGDPTLVTESAGIPNGEKFGRTIADIKNFLEEHDIPYNRILQTKPPACFLVDDRAITHKSWAKTIMEIKNRIGKW